MKLGKNPRFERIQVQKNKSEKYFKPEKYLNFKEEKWVGKNPNLRNFFRNEEVGKKFYPSLKKYKFNKSEGNTGLREKQS